jgi:PilZ domain-containing protein
MTERPHERRRSPRHEPKQSSSVRVPIVLDVKLVEISRSGVLFACTQSLEVGQLVQIRMLLGRQPFSASIQIVRTAQHSATETRGAFCFGATFVEVDDSSRSHLQRFLLSAPSHGA